MYLHDGQQSADGGLVYDFLLHLGHHRVAQHAELLEQALIVATGVKLDNEVATLGSHIGCVRTCLHQQSDVSRTIDLRRVAQRKVVEESTGHVGELHVGTQVYVSAQSYGKRIAHQSEAVEVGLGDVSCQSAFQTMTVHEGVDAYHSVEQVVMAVDMCLGASVLQLCLQSHVVQIPVSIAQVGYLSVDIHSGAGREEVGALTMCRQVCRNGIDGVVRHEVVDIDVADMHFGIIAHGIGIEVACKLDDALALTYCHISLILRSVCLGSTLCREWWHTVAALNVARQGSHGEVKVLRLGLELHIGTQAFHIVQVGHEAIGLGSKGCGQGHVEVAERHVLQIAIELSPDTQWILGPAFLHGLRQL